MNVLLKNRSLVELTRAIKNCEVQPYEVFDLIAAIGFGWSRALNPDLKLGPCVEQYASALMQLQDRVQAVEEAADLLFPRLEQRFVVESTVLSD